MSTPRRTLWGIALVATGLLGLLAVGLVTLLSGDPEPEPPAATPEEAGSGAEPEPEPEPEPPPPVRGEAEVAEVVDLSTSDTDLVGSGSSANEPVPVDEGAVDARVEALTAWLDEHLSDLQEGGDGLVAEVGLAGSSEVGQLAGPGATVESATYAFTLGVRGDPEWVRVEVAVTDEGGDTHQATLAFTGAEEPELQAAERR